MALYTSLLLFTAVSSAYTCQRYCLIESEADAKCCLGICASSDGSAGLTLCCCGSTEKRRSWLYDLKVSPSLEESPLVDDGNSMDKRRASYYGMQWEKKSPRETWYDVLQQIFDADQAAYEYSKRKPSMQYEVIWQKRRANGMGYGMSYSKRRSGMDYGRRIHKRSASDDANDDLTELRRVKRDGELEKRRASSYNIGYNKRRASTYNIGYDKRRANGNNYSFETEKRKPQGTGSNLKSNQNLNLDSVEKDANSPLGGNNKSKDEIHPMPSKTIDVETTETVDKPQQEHGGKKVSYNLGEQKQGEKSSSYDMDKEKRRSNGWQYDMAAQKRKATSYDFASLDNIADNNKRKAFFYELASQKRPSDDMYKALSFGKQKPHGMTYGAAFEKRRSYPLEDTWQDKRRVSGLEYLLNEEKRRAMAYNLASSKRQDDMAKAENFDETERKRKTSMYDLDYNKRRAMSYNTPLTKRKASAYDMDVAKRRASSYDLDFSKRRAMASNYGMGYEKRPASSYAVDYNKRKASDYAFAYDKRRASAYDLELSKRRASNYNMAFDKRKTMEYDFDQNKRKAAGYNLEYDKRRASAYDFGLDKRKASTYNVGYNKRKAAVYDFDFSKRRASTYDMAFDKRRASAYDMSQEKRPAMNYELNSSKRSNVSTDKVPVQKVNSTPDTKNAKDATSGKNSSGQNSNGQRISRQTGMLEGMVM